MSVLAHQEVFNRNGVRGFGVEMSSGTATLEHLSEDTGNWVPVNNGAFTSSYSDSLTLSLYSDYRFSLTGDATAWVADD